MMSAGAPVAGQNVAKKILVVDDDDINRAVVRVFMEHRGCIVMEAPSGEDALNFADLNGFDVILMDLSMPRMDGFETTRRIRAENKISGSTPIFALTAHNAEQNMEKCLGSGMTGVLAKPFDSDRADQLMSIISSSTGDWLSCINARSCNPV